MWNLVGHCSKDADKLFYRVSSPTVNDKQVGVVWPQFNQVDATAVQSRVGFETRARLRFEFFFF